MPTDRRDGTGKAATPRFIDVHNVSMWTCSALTKDGSTLRVCELDLEHEGEHDDLDGHTWP